MEATKRVRGTRKPLIAEPVVRSEQTDQIANLAAVLANPEGRKLSESLATAQADLRSATAEVGALRARVLTADERVATVESDLRSSTIALDWQKAEVLRLAESLATEKTFCATYQKDAGRFTGLLARISTTLSSCCEWDELPLAVESLLLRCNQYGDRSAAMGQANTQLQTERDQARAEAVLKEQRSSRKGEIEVGIARFEGKMLALTAALLCGLISYLVGRWTQ